MNLEQIVEKRTINLRESHEKIENIFVASPDAITIYDINGTIIEFNQATLDLFGYSLKDELIGKNRFVLVAKKDHKKLRENYQHLFERGVLNNIEYTALTKDGREFMMEVSSSVITNPSGNPTSVVAIIRDITER